ncbi:hypothetical protein D3C75_1095630 [compost metagenome]
MAQAASGSAPSISRVLSSMISGRPDVCVRIWRTVIASHDGGSSSRYSLTEASRSSFPASTSCIAATPVKALLIELMPKTVRSVTGFAVSRSDWP